MEFDLPKNAPSIIKVLGIGGGGSNAVNHMYKQGIEGVDFIICNTDNQALEASPVPHKVQLGASLTEGRGAGSKPEVGKNAAIETIDEVRDELLKNTKMVFITAGMGGGTGTGAAPIIAEACKELGILTVGIVTMPFFFEGRKRRQQAEEGIKAIRDHVDTLLVINNDKLREMYGNLKMGEAFAQADDVLSTAAKGIAEIITRTGHVNVDFEDVRTVMDDSGVAIMGSAFAEGDNRSIKAVEQALASPLLNDNDIKGARYVLLNMEYGSEEHELTMDEISDITDYIQEEAGSTADVIWGYGSNESLAEGLRVTIIATGFKSAPDAGASSLEEKPQRKVHKLEEDVDTRLTDPVSNDQNQKSEPAEPEKKEEENEPYLKNDDSKSDSQNQGTIEFDLENDKSKPREQAMPQDDFEPYLKNDNQPEQRSEQKENHQPETQTSSQQQEISMEEQQARAKERMKRLNDLTGRMRSPQGLSDLENEPAYKRRRIQLNDTPHSSESQVSRYTLGDENESSDDKNGGLNRGNSFLHDNVD
ncbi:cell division protein FtsZ [Salibacter halophilus]|uniref:Cell division protein FtsZ n=1 Tax=Salibacter halophilus TaxID=1803916 RepID=A0A6N6M5P3_9FLAO|nr:cell division protein FtsZ [Salibacter halophilus]KAB1062886.1 cell division protein FtsZ [Salibacter halophilus]